MCIQSKYWTFITYLHGGWLALDQNGKNATGNIFCYYYYYFDCFIGCDGSIRWHSLNLPYIQRFYHIQPSLHIQQSPQNQQSPHMQKSLHIQESSNIQRISHFQLTPNIHNHWKMQKKKEKKRRTEIFCDFTINQSLFTWIT